MHIQPSDNVVVAVKPLAAGTKLEVGGHAVQLREAIAPGHKFALADIPEGGQIIKYGHPIGQATRPVAAGDWVHVHNVRTLLSGPLEYEYRPKLIPGPAAGTKLKPQSFNGFRRSDGSVGVRNEIWLIPLVGCANGLAEKVAMHWKQLLKAEPRPAVDGIFSFPHPYGCSQLGDDHLNTQRILAGLAKHPNAGGVLLISLGCENNTLDSFRQVLGDLDPHRYRFMTMQEVGDEFTTANHYVSELLDHASACTREPVPVSELRIGLKCGASDAFSGLTGNPLLGAFSDLLVAQGGATVLTEVPEMFGAEHLLMERATHRGIFEKCVAMINGFKAYFLRHQQAVYENPSPGNKAGGISTLEEKSLGCIQKGGTSAVTDVVEYGGQIVTPGLNLLNGPGNDIVAVTALAAAGVHLILFTTGRGTPLGSPAPTIKVSTTSELAQRKLGWIDFDAGPLLDSETMPDMANRFFAYVLDVASGRRTRNEENGFREIAIFKDGVTL
jgi:altronate hydrolase